MEIFMLDPREFLGNSDDDDESYHATGEEKQGEFGKVAETKDLYRVAKDGPWEEWAPEDIAIGLNSIRDSEKFALIRRQEKHVDDSGNPILKLHSIIIQSPLIKEQLGCVFKGYRGINTNLKDLKFQAPFHPFFYRWTQLEQYLPSHCEDGEHYRLLREAIGPEIKPHIDRVSDLKNNNVISFDYIWALFEPEVEIYSNIDGQDRLYLLESGQYGKLLTGVKVYSISARFIDTDGHNFGYVKECLSISEFNDLKPISELNVLPSCLKRDIAVIRDRLTKRGQIFGELKGLHHKAYSGEYQAWEARSETFKTRYKIDDGRMYIDCKSFTTCTGVDPDKLGPLDEPSTSSHSSNSEAGNSLSRKYYPLCNPSVKGFCLKTKEWVLLSVDLLKEVEWSENAFKQLALPQHYKRIVYAFVNSQLSQSDDFDDVVRGKGKGVIMLLSGEPGTGKTLTSESVAEEMKKPLYSMGAGELGDTAGEVEDNLQRVLGLATRWNAVLLLDECDVFLEQRSPSSMDQNRLITVFLRALEYHQGVLFLTTNRLAAFDPAFESRIHLTIHFPKLGFNSRLSIWRNLAKPNSASSNLTEHELQELARTELNGRQIKNVIKTARLLAARDRLPLAFSHIEMVLKAKKVNYMTFSRRLAAWRSWMFGFRRILG
ncbi:P-loop containing nucleoside triphosphate hydrolase protein [Annulohypoxylon truncatum]|uniref:P-loop containing nucleoside triphosphate hydrolase protein n=1 Tax=Annulohypoxylon truncatum TaxID=327061 RepID=UPI0020083D9E|nr:P-loop containing nucleoside triphosphate hydrolase protein [Annulohypoxylon truncatum]KAI1206854.1 P-loop containing nucleoside triphosphate hydrolase protein [Annulohypoxylon truncatum]